MDIKILNNLFLTIARGNPLHSQDQIMFRNMVHLSLLKCGHVEMENMIDQGKPESWNSLEVNPLRGEHLLGRTAHSARNEETIHDRTGKPVSENVQDKPNFEELIMGSDTTEFVNKVKNQVQIRQKRMSSDVAEDCTEHSIIWGMSRPTTTSWWFYRGNEPCTSYSRTFTIHNYGYGIAYTFTHNNIMF